MIQSMSMSRLHVLFRLFKATDQERLAEALVCSHWHLLVAEGVLL